MSHYGRLWQEVSVIRNILRAHGIDVSSLAAAEESAQKLNADWSATFAKWRALEEEMAACDD